MKIVLFKSETIVPNNTLKMALQFFPGIPELYSDYPLEFDVEKVPGKAIPTFTEMSTEKLIEFICELDEPIFLGTSATAFTAECFNNVFAAYDHFSKRLGQVMIQPTFDNDLFAYTAPTILLYGDRHIYTTGNRITNNFPIVYGDSKTISELLNRILEEDSVEPKRPLFTDGIFHGGETIILSPLPPMAWNIEKELPVQVSSAAFDAKSYLESIPDFAGSMNPS